LEETDDPNTGWSVIVGSPERPTGRACVYKVAHHGSVNGHNDAIWEQLLVEQPFALVTPWSPAWSGGRGLPTEADVGRMTKLTPKAYSTARHKSQRVQPRVPAVEKTIRELGVRLQHAEPATGIVRLRNGGVEDLTYWNLELLRNACHLSEVHTI
jgi:hypothetical protein